MGLISQTDLSKQFIYIGDQLSPDIVAGLVHKK